MKEQIKEIARIILDVGKSYYGMECDQVAAMCEAHAVYDAGYRKQKVGKWLSVESDVIFKCSLCDAEISTSWDYENDNMFDYCPCCGAKMKGGAE